MCILQLIVLSFVKILRSTHSKRPPVAPGQKSNEMMAASGMSLITETMQRATVSISRGKSGTEEVN